MFASVIIPTFNRADALHRTMKSVARVDFPPEDFEIIVVDNGSTDRTRKVFEAMQEASPSHLWRYFYEPMPGLLSGRHKGALESCANICAFLDDDAHVEINWLNALKEAFRMPGVVLVGGPSLPAFEATPPEWLQDFYNENDQARFCGCLSLLDGGNEPKDIAPEMVWGLNYAIQKKALFEMGGFHPDCIPDPLRRYQGDGETGLSLKILKAGGRARYHPQAAVQHEVPVSRLTLDYFLKWARYAGVSSSYTEVRKEGRVSRRLDSWKDLARPATRFVLNLFRSERSPSRAQKDLVAQAYKRGFDFHHEAVRRDPMLLEWVLQKDYWDYALPGGWQDYLK